MGISSVQLSLIPDVFKKNQELHFSLTCNRMKRLNISYTNAEKNHLFCIEIYTKRAEMNKS